MRHRNVCHETLDVVSAERSCGCAVMSSVYVEAVCI